ncbi:MAG: 4Fe-4S dicluster domain-containing protein [Hyphomicrobiaceae bacterium]
MPFKALINGERCVHAKVSFATCRACVDACPVNALQLDDEALELDVELCSGCGRCQPACPWEALGLISDAGKAVLRATVDADTHDAYLACGSVADKPAAQRGGAGVPAPCIDTFGERDILELLGRGVRRLVVARDRCPHCQGQGTRPFDLAVQRIGAMQASRGQPPLRLLTIEGDHWVKRRADVERRSAELNQGLRRLFGLGRPAAGTRVGEEDHPRRDQYEHKGGSDGPLQRFVPEMNPASCNGCDACTRVCPTGALVLERMDGSLAYRIDARQCNGCGLCCDICEVGAISVHEMTRAATARLMLEENRCRSCGVGFHVPSGHECGGLCRICAMTAHQKSLFQVHGPDGKP